RSREKATGLRKNASQVCSIRKRSRKIEQVVPFSIDDPTPKWVPFRLMLTASWASRWMPRPT
ncbi:MAG: hypothetical protein KGI54_16450, partial [Pseudomonadota bacterium]|nr:hypothetical protein [Pseudomonadota bacterium]